MVTLVRRGAVVVFVSALLPVVSGVAAANPVSQVKDIDGYRVALSIEDVNIQSVPNMAGAALVREGFVSATSKLIVECTPPTPPVGRPAATATGENKCAAPAVTELNMTAQVGCPMDLSGGTKVSLDPRGTSSIPVQDVLQAILPPAPTPTPNDITDIGLLPTGQISPSVGVNLLPGYIRDVPLGKMQNPPDDGLLSALVGNLSLGKKADFLQNPKLTKPEDGKPPQVILDTAAAALGNAISKPGNAILEPLVISVRNFHLEVDQTDNVLAICGGAVAVRIYAQAKLVTATSFNTVDIYGEIFPL